MESYRGRDVPVVDPQIVNMDTSPIVPEDAPAQSDVDDLLRKKRKAREHKACYPCRSRKVKCDLSRPCQTCRDREHPELCSYHPPNKRQSVETGNSIMKTEVDPSSSGMIMLGRNEFDMLCHKLNGLEDSIAEMRRELELNRHTHERSLRANSDASPGTTRPDYTGVPVSHSHTDVHGIHTKNDAGEIVHFGGGSIPAMLFKLGQGPSADPEGKLQMQEMMGKTVLPLFGLDNESATYPFVDLWGLPHGSLQRAQELAKALPNDAQMLQLFSYYREVGHVIYPGIANVRRLEEDLDTFLARRASSANAGDAVTEQKVYGKTYHWLAVLFAVLASGAQCSTFPRKERELTSQVYVCCSFECLRFTNFLSQPHLESIQALLVIGNVMSNNMNAGTAWSLLGLTIRLAQGLGLHRSCPPHVALERVIPRSKVWWAVVWQDSLISITYDRASATTAGDNSTTAMPQNYTSIGAYHAVMFPLFKVGSDIVRARSTTASVFQDTYTRIVQQRDEIANIMRDIPEYLRDSRLCTSKRETLEHWGLYLHSSYLLSELYRPSLSPSQDSELAKAFKQPCIDNLTNTVEAYIGLSNITAFARQSWAALHRALSSALLLGILGEHTHNERARRLIARFIAVMVNLTDNVSPQEVATSVHRGICALQKLNIPGTTSQTLGLGFSCPADDWLAINEEGSLKVDQSAIITPSSTTGAEGDDHSPYSVLNTILWGNTDKREETLVM